ncbi:MAG: hypothetical protein QOE86_4655, partial [Solirubrobacteraceae bacterium]|nr:hypothetical protein [Solirubrobacteraceae bacterium]
MACGTAHRAHPEAGAMRFPLVVPH